MRPATGDRRPIVVGGCHRSGTSLVRRILNAHPSIHCGPEVKFLRDFYGDYVDDPIAHLRFANSARRMLPEPELLDILGRAFLELHERAARRAGKRRWADKSPENVIFLDAWRQLLGDDWLLVHVVRNPLDTLSSIKEWRFPAAIPASLDARIDFYLRYMRAGLDFERDHPDRYVRVVYDHLAASPEAVARALMARLGEPFDPRQLAFNERPQQRGVEDPKVARTRGVHGDSVGRWRTVLSAEEAALIADRTRTAWAAVDDDARWALPAA